jgi:hypothetical protein
MRKGKGGAFGRGEWQGQEGNKKMQHKLAIENFTNKGTEGSYGWIETRPSKKDGLVFVFRWRARKPGGGLTKRTELIGPVSALKTETNAWRAVENRKLDINSEDSRGTTCLIPRRLFRSASAGRGFGLAIQLGW